MKEGKRPPAHPGGIHRRLKSVKEGLGDLKAGRFTTLKNYVARRFGKAVQRKSR